MTESTRYTGGPAFPNQQDNSPAGSDYDGMTLRDWFAGQALAGLARGHSEYLTPPRDIAYDCYELADAMLAQREEE